MRDLLKMPVLGRGFRPFFLLGALYSAVSIGIWGLSYGGYVTPSYYFIASPIAWHAHEIIYGFAPLAQAEAKIAAAGAAYTAITYTRMASINIGFIQLF